MSVLTFFCELLAIYCADSMEKIHAPLATFYWVWPKLNLWCVLSFPRIGSCEKNTMLTVAKYGQITECGTYRSKERESFYHSKILPSRTKAISDKVKTMWNVTYHENKAVRTVVLFTVHIEVSSKKQRSEFVHCLVLSWLSVFGFCFCILFFTFNLQILHLVERTKEKDMERENGSKRERES